MTEFEILPGLPPYGAPAKPFTATEHGTHTEGFVVRFHTSSGKEWVGNFVGGSEGCSTTLEHPNGKWIVVISRGQGYVIDPETEALVETLADTIQDVVPCREIGGVVFGNGLGFVAIGPEGVLWRTRRIAWGDGVQNVRIENGTLLGEALDPMNECWTPFEVDVQSGRQIKGAWVSKDGEELRKVPTKRRTLFATAARLLKGER
jgi:hypothetical protein